MSTRKGVSGRDVPGASLTGKVQQGSAASKKKKKRGKKGPKPGANPAGQEGEEVLEQHDEGEADGNVGQEEADLDNAIQTEAGMAHGEDAMHDLANERAPGPSGNEYRDSGNSREPWTDPTDFEEDPVDGERQRVEKWFDGQRSQPYLSLSGKLQTKIIDHLVNHKYPDHETSSNASMRLMIWRAVIRANFWWVNPDTGQWTGKAKTIRVPDGVHMANFEMFVMCAAEREDRLGRDLPVPEYVEKVEGEVRGLIQKAEKGNMRTNLAHLAFLLMFDEEANRTLKLEDMQLRIGMAFKDRKIDWKGCDVFREGVEQRKPLPSNSNLAIANSIWLDALWQL